MTCKHCGETVRCGSCGSRVNSSQTNWTRKRLRRGLCARCPTVLTPYDKRHDHVLCLECRKKQADRSRARYARCGRKDRQNRFDAA